MYFFLRWKEETMLEDGGNYVQGPGHSLNIKSLGIRDLGPYTCQAFNGISEGRRAVSSTTVVKAMGPIDPRLLSDVDRRNLAYIVDAPTSSSARSRYPQSGPSYGGRDPNYGRYDAPLSTANIQSWKKTYALSFEWVYLIWLSMLPSAAVEERNIYYAMFWKEEPQRLVITICNSVS